MCLKDALLYLANGVEDIQQLLLRPGDTAAYADVLLCQTVVVFESVPPARQQAWRLSQRFSQEQVRVQDVRGCLQLQRLWVRHLVGRGVLVLPQQ
jgi:hypothetical protein